MKYHPIYDSRWFSNITYKVPFLQKWGTKIYVQRTYPSITDAEFERLWRESAERWTAEPRKRLAILGGGEETRMGAFFYDLAGYNYDRSEKYRCVEGCCVVEWLDGHNQGGFGPAGCPCDSLEDPRGEKIS